jgi:hypothetical protein
MGRQDFTFSLPTPENLKNWKPACRIDNPSASISDFNGSID